MPFLPRALTRYIAASAACSSSSADPATSGRVATPIEAVKCTDSPSDARKLCGPQTRSRMRSATDDGAVAAGIGQDQGEFVAAEPGHDVGFTGAAADDRGRLDERLAARQVAVAVVDLLEAVEVEEQQRQRPAAARRRAWSRGAAPG